MSKEVLIGVMRDNSDMSKTEAEAALKAVLDGIKHCLAIGEEVSLVGFGKFEIKQTSERKGRNPATGEEIIIPAKKVVKFKPGKSLKDAVEGE